MVSAVATNGPQGQPASPVGDEFHTPAPAHQSATASIGASLRLTEQEIRAYTGYKQAAKQLAVLHSMGFHRATLDRFGDVRLERPHFEAVCNSTVDRPRPKVKPPPRVRPVVKAPQ